MNETKIYHVHIGNGHHYFGSVAAIFDTFSPSELGVSKSRLYAYGITESKPYRNKKCVVRKGIIHRKKTGRNSLFR